jgi:hypothetical protein
LAKIAYIVFFYQVIMAKAGTVVPYPTHRNTAVEQIRNAVPQDRYMVSLPTPYTHPGKLNTPQPGDRVSRNRDMVGFIAASRPPVQSEPALGLRWPEPIATPPTKVGELTSRQRGIRYIGTKTQSGCTGMFDCDPIKNDVARMIDLDRSGQPLFRLHGGPPIRRQGPSGILEPDTAPDNVMCLRLLTAPDPNKLRQLRRDGIECFRPLSRHRLVTQDLARLIALPGSRRQNRRGAILDAIGHAWRQVMMYSITRKIPAQLQSSASRIE